MKTSYLWTEKFIFMIISSHKSTMIPSGNHALSLYPMATWSTRDFTSHVAIVSRHKTSVTGRLTRIFTELYLQIINNENYINVNWKVAQYSELLYWCIIYSYSFDLQNNFYNSSMYTFYSFLCIMFNTISQIKYEYYTELNI